MRLYLCILALIMTVGFVLPSSAQTLSPPNPEEEGDEPPPPCVTACAVSGYSVTGPVPCPNDPAQWCNNIVVETTATFPSCSQNVDTVEATCPAAAGDPQQNCAPIRDAICGCRRFNGEDVEGECPPEPEANAPL